MNPFRQSDTSGESYNKTEVELARIRETEETKRQRTAQREQTKQARVATDGYWVIRFASLAAAVGAMAIGYGFYAKHVDATHPELAHSECVETAEIVTVSTAARECAHGGWFETTPSSVPGQELIRCHCGPKPTSSAAPASSEK